MFYNYLKTSLRSLLKNKSYSIINIFGLALGITSVFLILQYVQREFGYDKFHEGAENIYRISWENSNPQTRTPHPMAQALVRDFSEVENAVSLSPLWGPGLTRETFSIRNIEKDIQYDEMGVLAVDSTFFEVFTFPLVKGDPKTVLRKPGGILLSESAAAKYFGSEDPIGKFLSVNDDRVLIEVAGVFKDVPELSHFHFDFLVSYVLEKALEDPESEYYTWRDFGHYNYVRLKPGADPKKLESQLLDWVKKYVDWAPEDFRLLTQNNQGFRLQPITDIHLTSNLRWELEANGNIEYVYMLMAAAALILIIACINFINLTTAQSAERAKEIGIRKSLGAFRHQLMVQFTGESIIVAFMAMLISLVMIEIALPFFSIMTNYTVELELLSLISILAALGLLVGIVAGLYPSFYLSAVKPTAVLKGKFLQSPKGALLRKGFTVFQFSASMILICASLIIFHQLTSIKTRSLGFAKEEVVVLPIKNRDALRGRMLELQSELGKLPGVVSVSAVSNIPGRSFNQNEIYDVRQPDQPIDASEMMGSYDVLNVLTIPLAEGRTFIRDNPADLESAFLLNETAANQLNLGQPVGKEIVWARDGQEIKGTVVGIVKDFHFQSLHQPVRPLLIKLGTNGFNFVIAKVKTTDFTQTIADMESTWKNFDSRFTFEFFFLSDTVNQQYQAENNMGKILVAFSVIAILIACFGLLGMAALTFRNKTKEISVRKILGAEFAGLVYLLLKDFTILILASIVLAIPVALWMMNDWLQNFSYRVEINPLVFAGAGLLLILLAWLTLGYLTFQVAKTNPATTLKNE